jgi:hypothetical protein
VSLASGPGVVPHAARALPRRGVFLRSGCAVGRHDEIKYLAQAQAREKIAPRKNATARTR